MEQLNYQNVQGAKNGMPINDNKALAIVALVLSIVCCNIISIVLAVIGVVKSNDVTKFAAAGQQQLAMSAAKSAKLFSWIAIGLLVLGLIINFIFIMSVGGVDGYMEMVEKMMNK
ncbi:MAG: CD225/dispanin family protein [Prevotella sp.]|nr:CD225/dispanin family protein [Prevotella sp.]